MKKMPTLLACTMTGLLVLLLAPYRSGIHVNKEVSDSHVDKELVSGMNSFATSLLQKLSEERQGENLFFSPYSISAAVAMTLLGARGNTEAELLEAFHWRDLTSSDLHLSMMNFLKLMNSEENLEHILQSANRLFLQENYRILADFTADCQRYYDAPAENVDFGGNTEEVRQLINTWVEDKTHDKIKELLKPGIIGDMTRAVLVNAIYFKGSWLSKFKEDLTTPGVFHVSSNEVADVDMMYQKHKFVTGVVPELQSRLLELPYKGEDIKMTIILPDEGVDIHDVEANMDINKLKKVRDYLRKREVEVRMPKFKLTDEFNLEQTLPKLGINDLFDAAADLSGVTGNKDLFVSNIIHKSYIDVNEEGAEAAAATAVIMKERSMVFKENFTMDRPFLFLIQDTRTDIVLFMGRVMKPSAVNGRDEL